jgi:hypothetical protein
MSRVKRTLVAKPLRPRLFKIKWTKERTDLFDAELYELAQRADTPLEYWRHLMMARSCIQYWRHPPRKSRYDGDQLVEVMCKHLATGASWPEVYAATRRESRASQRTLENLKKARNLKTVKLGS